MQLVVAAIVLVIAGIGLYVGFLRARTPRFGIEAIGSEAAIGHGGLMGHRPGTIRWRGLIVDARMAPGANRDIMAEGTAVIIIGIEDGVALVTPKS